MPETKITTEEWRAALGVAELAGPLTDDSRSVEDIAEALGMSRAAAGRHVRTAVKAGRMMACGRRMDPTIDGRHYPVPVYRPVKA